MDMGHYSLVPTSSDQNTFAKIAAQGMHGKMGTIHSNVVYVDLVRVLQTGTLSNRHNAYHVQSEHGLRPAQMLYALDVQRTSQHQGQDLLVLIHVLHVQMG